MASRKNLAYRDFLRPNGCPVWVLVLITGPHGYLLARETPGWLILEFEIESCSNSSEKQKLFGVPFAKKKKCRAEHPWRGFIWCKEGPCSEISGQNDSDRAERGASEKCRISAPTSRSESGGLQGARKSLRGPYRIITTALSTAFTEIVKNTRKHHHRPRTCRHFVLSLDLLTCTRRW